LDVLDAERDEGNDDDKSVEQVEGTATERAFVKHQTVGDYLCTPHTAHHLAQYGCPVSGDMASTMTKRREI